MSASINRILDFYIMWEFFPRDRKLVKETLKKINKLECNKEFTKSMKKTVIKRLNNDVNMVDNILQTFPKSRIIEEFDKEKLKSIRKDLSNMISDLREYRRYTYEKYFLIDENVFDKRNNQYQLFCGIKHSLWFLFDCASFLQSVDDQISYYLCDPKDPKDAKELSRLNYIIIEEDIKVDKKEEEKK